MTHPASPITHRDFDELMERVRQAVERLRDGARRLIDRVNRFLPWLGPSADHVRQLLTRFGELLTGLFDELRQFWTRRGDPDFLETHGAAWKAEVGDKANHLTSVLATKMLDVDNYWEGDAGNAYLATIPVQQAALDKLAETANDLQSILKGIANAVTAFWVEVCVAFAVAAVTIIGAGAAAVTVVGAPGAVSTAVVGMSVALVAFAGAAIHASVTFSGELSSKLIDLQHQDLVHAPWESGSWPRSTTGEPPVEGSSYDEIPADPRHADWRVRW